MSSVDLSLANPKIFLVLLGSFSPGMTIAVFHCSGSFHSVQDWLNKLMILFSKERGALA